MAKILVIDDSPTARMLALRALAPTQHQLVMLETAVGAIGVMRSERPDLVLLDLSMPELDGEDFIEVLYKFGMVLGAKIVIYSDQDPNVLEMVAARTGVLGYIHKTTADIAAEVERFLKL
jgi:CheY-like chemotaxis protein